MKLAQVLQQVAVPAIILAVPLALLGCGGSK